MYKAAIFDLDGTLCYTIDDLRTAMNAMLAEKGYPERSVEEILSAINFGAREFVRRSLPESLRDDDDIVEECFRCYSSHYDRHYLDTTYTYDGIVELIADLRRENIKTAVLSNKGDSHTKALIDKLFAKGDFDIVQGGSDRFPTKPDPSCALWIASELKVLPGEVLYIGDSDVDMKTAVNAGFHPCGVSWGYRSVDILRRSGSEYIVQTPAQILTVATQ